MYLTRVMSILTALRGLTEGEVYEMIEASMSTILDQMRPEFVKSIEDTFGDAIQHHGSKSIEGLNPLCFKPTSKSLQRLYDPVVPKVWKRHKAPIPFSQNLLSMEPFTPSCPARHASCQILLSSEASYTTPSTSSI